MILDDQNLYSDAQAFTSTAVSEDIIDHESQRNIGIGEPLTVVITLDAVADNGDADETYVVDLETDDNSGFSSATTIGTVTIPRGSAAGTQFTIHVRPSQDFERFSRLNATLGGTTPSVTFTAGLILTSGVQNDQEFPSGFTIS